MEQEESEVVLSRSEKCVLELFSTLQLVESSTTPCTINERRFEACSTGGISAHCECVDCKKNELCIIKDNTAKTIHSLPDEIIVKIFSFFTHMELYEYVAPVCRSWNTLAKDRGGRPLKIVTAVDFDDVDNYMLVSLIAWCKTVHRLELNGRSDLTFHEFKDIFENNQELEILSLAFCSQVDMKIISLMSTCCKTLSSINLEGCSQVTDKEAIFISRNFKRLTEVNLDGVPAITYNSISVLVSDHSESLQKVFLDGENVTDRSMHLLSSCLNLTAVSVSFCGNMTEESIIWLGKCTNLQHMQLQKGGFTESSLLYYIKIVDDKQAKGFKFLNLAKCAEISDECLLYIGEKFENLEYLDLSWCLKVSDVGLSFIINSCHKLNKLFLRGLHKISGTLLTKICNKLPNLMFLDLFQCNKVQDEHIDHIVSKMKNLIILDYLGDVVIATTHRRAHLIT